MKIFCSYIPFSVLFIICFLGGCGTYVPQVQEIWDGPDGGRTLEIKIKQKVYCELKEAVIGSARLNYVRDGKELPALPDDWGVQVTMYLLVEETSALNPGVTFNTPIIPGTTFFPGNVAVTGQQQYNLGLGGTLSSRATRTDKFTFYYLVRDLKIPLGAYDSCNSRDPRDLEGSSFLLESDLGIPKWLLDALSVEYTYRSTPLAANADPGLKQDVLSYEIKFEVVSGGNITPSWKLVRVSTNQGPFFGVNRGRTHDLLITFGPSQKAGTVSANKKKGGPPEPDTMAANSHLASQIGLAVANSIRTLTLP